MLRVYLSSQPSVNTVNFVSRNTIASFGFKKQGQTCKVRKMGANVQLRAKMRVVMQFSLKKTMHLES
jgi:hypothetical protein